MTSAQPAIVAGKRSAGAILFAAQKAMRLADLPSIERAVFIDLAGYSDAAGSCFPSVALLAKGTGVSVRRAISALAVLETRGWLARQARSTARGRTSNAYQIQVDRLLTQSAPRAPSQSAPRAPSQPTQSARGDDPKCTDCKDGCTTCTLGQDPETDESPLSLRTDTLESQSARGAPKRLTPHRRAHPRAQKVGRVVSPPAPSALAGVGASAIPSSILASRYTELLVASGKRARTPSEAECTAALASFDGDGEALLAHATLALADPGWKSEIISTIAASFRPRGAANAARERIPVSKRKNRQIDGAGCARWDDWKRVKGPTTT